jgi:hypothetical protein
MAATCTTMGRRGAIVPRAILLLSTAAMLSCSASRVENRSADEGQQAVPNAATSTECYRFDRPYFHWLEPYEGDRALLPDSIRVSDIGDGVPRISASTDVLMLTETASADLGSGNRTGSLEPIPYGKEGAVRRNWLRNSHWRIGEGVAHIKWYSGFFGPEFQMQVLGDTLRGTVRFRTDAGAEPPPEPAWALRVPCP